MSDTAFADFESRSACPIKKTGSWVYSVHPSTEIMCLGFRLPYWEAGRTGLWHPAYPHLEIEEEGVGDLVELFNWVLGDGLIAAHNSWFDRSMWQNNAVPKLGWPAIPLRNWRCTAAKAAAHALPRSVEDAGAALKLTALKDMVGHQTMKKVSKPRKLRKAEVEAWIQEHGKKAKLPVRYHESKELFEILWAYCRKDVLAEQAISDAVPDLSETETEMFLLDQTINERGFQLDMAGVSVALSLIGSETKRLNGELSALTGGSPDKATQRLAMRNWFADQWYVLEDTQGPTIDLALKEDDLDPKVRRGLELIQTLGRASTAKYQAMANWACGDGRVRGGLLYHGASTGRWSGAGVQPHNFPKGKVRDIEGAWGAIKSGDPDTIRGFLYDGKEKVGDVLKLLSQSLRGAIIASPGKKLFVADYSSIEARVLLWCARDDAALDLFRQGRCIYMDFASDIFKYPVTDKEKQKMERGFGKVGILGLGYQCGADKFVDVAWTLGGIVLPLESNDPNEITSRQIVAAYREKYWRVKQLWYDQEAAAILATRNPGDEVPCYPVTWLKDDQTLYCMLPGGRRLAFPFAQVKTVRTSWGSTKQGLTHMGVNSLTRKWQRQTVYGGLLVENLVQAISRNIMADAMIRLEQSKIYQPILSVHDELISEANEHLGDVHEYTKIVAEVPLWAKGCPIEAESWAGRRYKK